MEKDEFLKTELDNNNMPEKYFNSYKKMFLFLNYTFLPVVTWIVISAGILAGICLANEEFASYFQNLIVKGSRSDTPNILIIFFILIVVAVTVSYLFVALLEFLEKRLFDLVSNLAGIKWLEAFNLFNTNDFKIESVNIETFLIEKAEFNQIFMPNSSKKVLINNEIGLKTKKR